MSSIRFNWKLEALKWLPGIEEPDVCVVSSGTGKLYGSVRIVSYDLVATLCQR
jgi:hypothetical protein